MPNAPDKVIINHGGLRSFFYAISGWFHAIFEVLGPKRGAERLAWEIENNDWSQEQEAKDFLAEQEVDCAEIDKACETMIDALRKFHQRQMDRNDRMRVYIDNKLAQKTP